MMKLFFSSLIAFGIINELQIPDKWNPEFTISLSDDGGMSGAETEIKYSYSECTYHYASPSGKPVDYTFKLTEKMRSEILQQLRTLKLDKIKSSPGTFVADDGWSKNICFGLSCIEAGSTADISAEDKNTFLHAFNYLQQIALDGKP